MENYTPIYHDGFGTHLLGIFQSFHPPSPLHLHTVSPHKTPLVPTYRGGKKNKQTSRGSQQGRDVCWRHVLPNSVHLLIDSESFGRSHPDDPGDLSE